MFDFLLTVMLWIWPTKSELFKYKFIEWKENNLDLNNSSEDYNTLRENYIIVLAHYNFYKLISNGNAFSRIQSGNSSIVLISCKMEPALRTC